MIKLSADRGNTPGYQRPSTTHFPAFRLGWCVVLVLSMFLAAATSASASWTSTGSGTGGATVATLSSPTNVVAAATVGGSTVSVSWTPSTVSTGQPAQGYYVTRTTNGAIVAACGTAATSLTSSQSCSDLSVPDGTYSYRVTAVYRSWTAAGDAGNSATVSAASKLVFTGQPSLTVAGASISPAIAVGVQDAASHPIAVAGIPVTVGIGTNPASGSLAGTVTALSNADGVATFGTLSIDRVGTGYTLAATSSGLASATSSGFTVIAAAASTVSFTQQPTTTIAGAAITPAVTVQITDQFGNLTSSTAAVTIALGSNPANGTLSGTRTRAAVAGVATFTGLSVDKASSGYSLAAGGAGLTAATSKTFTISAAGADKFVFTSAPFSAQASTTATLGPITVQAQDSFGNPVTAPAGGTSMTLTSNSAATNTFAATQGGPSVTGVTIPAGSSGASFFYADTRAGSPVITVSASLTSATQTETITAAAATNLAFNQQPTATAAGASITPAVTVRIRDQFGNLTGSTAAVTLAIGTNPGGGTLSGTQTQNATAGLATFSGISIDKAGSGYTLTATGDGLSPTTSTPFAVSAGAAGKFVITSAPVSGQASSTATLGPVTVQQQDLSGNPVTAVVNTTVNLSSNSTGTKIFAATSGGTSVPSVIIAAGSSTATFYYGDTRAGNPSITVAGSLTSATQAETVSAAPANRLAFNQQPTQTTAGTPISPAVTVQTVDQFGNLASSTVAITLAIAANPGGGVLSGTPTQAAIAGVATFGNLSINKAGAGYTFAASGGGLTGATSSSFTIVAGAASQLAWTSSTAPGCAVPGGSAFALTYSSCGGNGTTFTSNLTLTDGNGNSVVNSTGNGITVSVTATGGNLTGAVGGILTVTIPNGASTSGQITFTPQAPSWISNTITAKSTGYADAAATFNK